MGQTFSRPYGRLIYLLLAMLLWVGVSNGADEPATTTIVDVVYRADSTPASGILLISWPAFTTADNKPVAAGTKSVTLGPQGALSVELVPNAGAIPAGTLYRVVSKWDDGTTAVEYWSVGTSSPTTIAAIRTTPGSGSASQIVSRQYVDALTAGKANDAAVVHKAGAETIDGMKQFAAPPSVPTPLQATDAVNKAYVDGVVAAVGAGSYVSKSGDTMNGPLTLAADPSSPTQAATRRYVDNGLAAKADLVTSLVRPTELGTGTADASKCLKGDQTWGACGTSSNAISIQGVPVDTTAPTDGQVQTYDATSGEYTPKSGGGLSGNATQIQGVNVDTAAPVKGQMQVFDDAASKYRPQSKAWIDPRDYGARCNNTTDDSTAFQTMFNANPGGHFLLPGSASSAVTCYFTSSLTPKGAGWILEGGGASFAGGGQGGTTMRWAGGTSGLIVLNSQGNKGVIRNLNLQGGETFVGAENAPWPDAILPSFTDQTGFNIFKRSISSISRAGNVTTVQTAGIANEIGCHTYSPGTQITIAGVADSSYNGLYYITGVSSTQGAGCFDTFTYANSGNDGGSSGGTAAISNTGTSTSDGIVAGANYLTIEDVNLQNWGRFAINCASDSATYWCDNDSFHRVTITNGRGIGVYIRGGDSNAGDFQQINVQVALAGGIFDAGFLGNTWLAPNVTNAGADVASTIAPAVNLSSVSCSSNVCTATTAAPHGLVVGQAAVLSGLADGSFQAPSGSAVFVASAPTSTSLTYKFTHGNGTTTGGTIRLANATELFTAAGIGQNPAGTGGTGFGYWISGANDNRIAIQPYCEGTSGPSRFGGTIDVIGGAQGCPLASGFNSYAVTANGKTSVTNFDSNPFGALPDRGTSTSIRGGHVAEYQASEYVLDHNNAARWSWNSIPTSTNSFYGLYNGAYPTNPRLLFYEGTQGPYSIASAVRSGNKVTVTLQGNHRVTFGVWVTIAGVSGGTTSFNLSGQVLAYPTSSNSFVINQTGPDESATPNTGSVTLVQLNYPGYTDILGQGTGPVRLNFSGSTGGTCFGSGASTCVATVNSSGLGTFNGGISTTKLSGVTDTTLVANLNVDMVGGKHASDLATVISPALTGTPTAPTPATGDNSTAIATTAWVRAQNSGGGGGSINWPLTAATDGTTSAPAYAFGGHPEIGLMAAQSKMLLSILSVQSAADGTATIAVDNSGNNLNWPVGATINVAGLPSNPNDLTMFNGNWTLATVNTAAETFTFSTATTSTYGPFTPATGTATIYVLRLPSYATMFNRLESSSNNPARRGSIRFAWADDVRWRAGNGANKDLIGIMGGRQVPFGCTTNCTGGLVQLGDSDGAETIGPMYAPWFVSSVATGTQPYAATPTTLNVNLNADLLDGHHAADFANTVHAHGAADTVAGIRSGGKCLHTSTDGTQILETASDCGTASGGGGEGSTFTGDKTITGNLNVGGNASIGGTLTVTGAYQVESSVSSTTLTVAGTGNSKIGFDSDGKLKVSENAGAVTEVAKISQIPAAQVNADWSASSGVAQILNKPSSFPPSTHTHPESDVSGLASDLPKGILTTKGDLIGYGSAPARQGVGFDGQVLVADSSQTLGIKWGYGAGANINTIGQGFVFLPYIAIPSGGATNVTAAGTANQVRVTQITLPVTITVGKIVTNIATASSSQTAYAGVYDGAGNKLLEGSFSCSATGGVSFTLATPVTLPAGTYLYAHSASDTTCALSGVALGGGFQNMLTKNATRQGTAASGISGGVMPAATLGTISYSGYNPPVVMLER
jgi:hypothetical protein